MRPIAWDSWAFLETFLRGPRASSVESLLEDAGPIVTVREVVAETFNFLVRRSGRTALGWTWLKALAASRIQVHEPPLELVVGFLQRSPREGNLSFTDYALALVAKETGCESVASEDAEFHRLGLRPLFSRRSGSRGRA